MRLVLGFTLGAVIGGGIWLVVLTLVYRDAMPPLTPERLEQARALWEKNGPDSYEMELVIQGRQPGTVFIEVRDDQVVRMTRDGHTPRQRRTWEYWRVEGQFDTLARDLRSAERPDKGFGAPAGSRVILRAEFDKKYGYPRRYRRVVSGTDLNVEWKVTRFTPH